MQPMYLPRQRLALPVGGVVESKVYRQVPHSAFPSIEPIPVLLLLFPSEVVLCPLERQPQCLQEDLFEIEIVARILERTQKVSGFIASQVPHHMRGYGRERLREGVIPPSRPWRYPLQQQRLEAEISGWPGDGTCEGSGELPKPDLHGGNLSGSASPRSLQIKGSPRVPLGSPQAAIRRRGLVVVSNFGRVVMRIKSSGPSRAIAGPGTICLL